MLTYFSFHKKLKTFYPHLMVKEFNGVTSDEIYKFNPVLVKEYDKFNGMINDKYFYDYKKEELLIQREKEKTKQVEAIIQVKLAKEKTKQETIAQQTKQVEIQLLVELLKQGVDGTLVIDCFKKSLN